MYDESTEQFPEESQSPGGFPPTSGLPPDAMMMLSGMSPGMMHGGGMGGGMPQGQMGGQQPPGGGSYQMTPGMDQNLPGGIGAQMAGMPGGPQMDPMLMIKQQFDGVVSQLQLMAQAFPMAVPELQEAGEAIARAMLKVAQGVQPDPMTPLMPA